MAAVASEEVNDKKYLEIVDNVGGECILLVCETFGVWTPYALSILFAIASMPSRSLQRMTIALVKFFYVASVYSCS